MKAFNFARATKLVAGGALVAATAAVLGSGPVLAFTCEDVRGLTKAEQNYWSKQLNLTPEQRNRIWLECYGQARATETKGGSLKPTVVSSDR